MAVGGNVVALLKDDDVADDDLLDRQEPRGTVSQNLYVLRQQPLQRGQCPLDPVFLPE